MRCLTLVVALALTGPASVPATGATITRTYDITGGTARGLLGDIADVQSGTIVVTWPNPGSLAPPFLTASPSISLDLLLTNASTFMALFNVGNIAYPFGGYATVGGGRVDPTASNTFAGLSASMGYNYNPTVSVYTASVVRRFMILRATPLGAMTGDYNFVRYFHRSGPTGNSSGLRSLFAIRGLVGAEVPEVGTVGSLSSGVLLLCAYALARTRRRMRS